ncbi:hypothetical protein [Rubritalea tangerina]|uniref:hypothetical protein n=1 Tax=Rubritalea tangerina TaxID=430798 RepID=UPI0036124DBE
MDHATNIRIKEHHIFLGDIAGNLIGHGEDIKASTHKSKYQMVGEYEVGKSTSSSGRDTPFGIKSLTSFDIHVTVLARSRMEFVD